MLTGHQRADRMRQLNAVVLSGISSLSVDLKEREKVRHFSGEKRKEYTKAHKLVIREEFNRAGAPLKLNAARLENCVLFYRRVSREALRVRNSEPRTALIWRADGCEHVKLQRTDGWRTLNGWGVGNLTPIRL